MHAADESPNRYSSAVPLRRATIRRESNALLDLAAVLCDTNHKVNVRGIALADRLLTDGESPLYVESDEETLEGAIRHTRAALLLN